MDPIWGVGHFLILALFGLAASNKPLDIGGGSEQAGNIIKLTMMKMIKLVRRIKLQIRQLLGRLPVGFIFRRVERGYVMRSWYRKIMFGGLFRR